MIRSLIGFLGGLGAPWWLYASVATPGFANAAAFAVCVAGVLYYKRSEPTGCCSSSEDSAA